MSPAKTWLRALELTAPIAKNKSRILPVAVEELAKEFGQTVALLSDREQLTYDALAKRMNQYGNWALGQGLTKGQVVCLFMPNRPEYLAVWLGITRIGGVVALLNTNLTGPSLAHAINVAGPRHLIVAAEFIDRVDAVRADIGGGPAIWVHGAAGCTQHPRIDHDLEGYADRPLSEDERPA